MLEFNFAQDVIDRLASEERTGLIFIDEVGHRRDYSFAEISEQSQRYAAVLDAFGVARGERVALRASNTAKCLFTLLALDRLGTVRIPCMEAWNEEQIVQVLSDTGAETIVSNRKYRAQIDALRNRLPELRKFISVGEDAEGWTRLDVLTARTQPFAGITTQDSDPAFVAGSISYPESALFEAGRDARERLQLAETDRFWCTLAMGSAAWMVNALIAAWSCGAAMVIQEGAFDALERLELLRELDVTVLLQPPEEYEAQAALEGIRLRLPRLRRCFSAGEAVDPHAAQRWQQTLGVPIERIASGVRSLQKA